MVQLRDEEEAKRLRVTKTEAETLEEEQYVLEPETAAIPDPLFDDPEIEQEDYFGQVNELQDHELLETEWAHIALAFTQYAPAMPNVAVGQDERAVSVNPETGYCHGLAVGSIAGAEGDDEDTEHVYETEVAFAGDDTIPDSFELQDETRTQIAQPNSELLVEPDVEVPQNVTSPASRSSSRRDSTQGMLDDDDDESTPPSTSPQSPTPSTGPPPSSAVKTRASRSSARATKKPRLQPLSPNAQLSDTDERKQWCVCRGVDDGRKMVMCAAARCREKWFHFGCVWGWGVVQRRRRSGGALDMGRRRSRRRSRR